MSQPEQLICCMRNGHSFAHCRLPGRPRVPGAPAVIEVDPAAARALRRDCNVLIFDELPGARESAAEPEAVAVAGDLETADTPAEEQRSAAREKRRGRKGRRGR